MSERALLHACNRSLVVMHLYLHVKDKALQRQAQVGRQLTKTQLPSCIDLLATEVTVVLVVARQLLSAQHVCLHGQS